MREEHSNSSIKKQIAVSQAEFLDVDGDMFISLSEQLDNWLRIHAGSLVKAEAKLLELKAISNTEWQEMLSEDGLLLNWSGSARRMAESEGYRFADPFTREDAVQALEKRIQDLRLDS